MKYYWAALMAFVLLQVNAQENDASNNIEERYDQLTEEWLGLSRELTTYDGLAKFCNDADYRKYALNLLGHIHHYDSLVLRLLSAPANAGTASHKEYKSSLKDIRKFEEKYSLKAFIAHLRSSCGDLHSIEHDKEELKKNSGMYSYDGQRLVIENEIGKYLKHTTKQIQVIDEHVHKLHLEDVNSYVYAE